MEHNIIVNNSRQVSNVVTALQFFRIHWHTIEQLANLVGAFNPLPDFTDDDLNSLFEIQEQFSAINVKELEAEKPKHRYAIYERNKFTPTYEYDYLGEAWKGYETCYSDEAESGCRVDEGDYILRDEWLNEDITSEVPYLDLEYEWDADITIRLNGSRVDFDDLSYGVREEIGNEVSCGDTYGTYTDEVGSVSWDDISSWEEEHKEETSGDVCWDEAVKEVNNNAEEESTEA